jgi:hypothetical protein
MKWADPCPVPIAEGAMPQSNAVRVVVQTAFLSLRLLSHFVAESIALARCRRQARSGLWTRLDGPR